MRARLPWQVEPARRLAGMDCGLVAMDKRLGKCTLAIKWACKPGVRHVLVVAPSSAQPGWLDQFEYDEVRGHLLEGNAESKLSSLIELDARSLLSDVSDGKPARVPVMLPTYYLTGPQSLFIPKAKNGRSEPSPNDIALLPWDAVIWDEITNIKSWKSQVHDVAFACFGDIRFRLGLSGEPAAEGALDLFEPMLWCYGRWMGARNRWQWIEQNFHKVGYSIFPKPGHAKLIRESFQAQAIVLSRKDAGLPNDREIEPRWINLPPRCRRVYDHCEKYLEMPFDADAAAPADLRLAQRMIETKYSIVRDVWLHQLAGGYPADFPHLSSPHKMEVLFDLLQGEYVAEKVVVLFRHNAELDEAVRRAKKAHLAVEVLRGGITIPERRRIEARFQKGVSQHCFAQMKAVKYGVDLSAADVMIRYSLWDAWDDISQSMDRIVHATKKTRLYYIDLICRDTVEEEQYYARQMKGVTARSYIDKLQEGRLTRLAAKFGKAVADV